MILHVLLAHTALALAPTPTKENLKELLSQAEWETIVGLEDHDGLEIVYRKEGEGGSGEARVVEVGGLALELRPSAPRLDPHFVLLSRDSNSSRLLPTADLLQPHCYYSALPPNFAAFHLCDGMRGMVMTENEELLFVSPLPKRFHKRSVDIPHVVVRKSLRWLRSTGARPASQRPSQASTVHVETAVFVDTDLYSHMTLNFPTDTERELVRFVLAMVNAVELLYHDPSLGRPVSFVMKRLEILHNDPQGLVRSHDIDRFLGNFCAWQKTENPPEDSDPLHWDHALILTGLDLYVLSKNGKLSRQVVGLAPVAGMCTPTSSCTVNEGRHFESVYVVAHEIGHNLGMRHDGPLADNNCDPGSYLMSPTLGSGKITWSSCSRHYLEKFLHTPQSHCLMDHSTPGMQLDHGVEGTLPGERFDANQQCMLKYGRGSIHSSSQPLGDICRDLHCTRDRYTWTSHPALEGTPCGPGKWCRSGRCIDKSRSKFQAVEEAVKGGWSKWSTFSDCASSCLYGDKGSLASGSTGVMVASRLCNNPRPENGGEPCVGSDKKYKTCTPNQCENVPRTSIQNFADEVCLRAKEVDGELTGTGFQKSSSNPEDACTVWCHRRGGGIKSKGWTFPDGTTCQTHRRHRPMYCISGICQEFKCSGSVEDDIFAISPGMCTSTMLFSRDKRREVMVGVWLPVSDCYFNCISPGQGLRLVEKRPCRHCNVTASIQLCQPKTKECESVKTTVEQASSICAKYMKKVSRLSGFGMQLSASQEDPDRPCRLACQDEEIPHRFYLVNGEEGWFPFGTDCSRGDTTRKAFCVSGRCLEFGSDDCPLHESSYGLPDVHSRHRRSTGPFELPGHNFSWILLQSNHGNRYDKEVRIFSIDFDNPVNVKEEELNYINDIYGTPR